MYKKIQNISYLRGGYVYSRGYVYCFSQMFQGLRLFKGVRLFRTLEYYQESRPFRFFRRTVVRSYNDTMKLSIINKTLVVYFGFFWIRSVQNGSNVIKLDFSPIKNVTIKSCHIYHEDKNGYLMFENSTTCIAIL
jgi:hypothetical protein